ncbi:MAG: hypothetical protein IMF12_02990 [Proteobacteria bacterium]|nr:hypothetical protein [Pseudomonadota bacterium]
MQVLSNIKIEEQEFAQTNTDMLLTLLAELTILLQNNSFQAVDLLPNIKNNLGKDLQNFYYDLEQYINNFEFTAAQKTVNKLTTILDENN